MKPKTAVKLIVDIVMTILLLMLMGYHLWGTKLHEIAGVALFVLFIIHHILNAHWHKNLFKGRYNLLRTLTLLVDLLVLITILMQMYSGIVMSRYLFDIQPLRGGMMLARRLHLLGSYWGLILMSVHLGLHLNMIIAVFRKLFNIKGKSKIAAVISFLVGMIIAVMGVRAFVNRDLATYLFLKTEFVFFDFSEAKTLFYLDYLVILWLFVFISHYAAKVLRMLKKKD